MIPTRAIFDEETLKIMIAAAGGFGAMYTNFDMIIKILIGVATLVYLVLKIKKELTKK